MRPLCVLSLFCLVFGAHCQSLRTLPSGPLNMGYSSICNPSEIINAVVSGVNVVFWFSIDLVNDNGTAAVVPSALQPLPSLDCIASVVSTLISEQIPTTHMVSVGGWGAPHPTTDFSAEVMWAAWKDWNENTVAAAGIPGGFAGIDWDMEGADDPSAPQNYLTKDMLDLVGQMSQLAKQDGYIVSMVPPESYLDPTTSLFDGSLLHPYPEWEGIVNFNYHGHNGYAYLLAKYGKTITAGVQVDTYDLVAMQLYEGYSHADYNTTAAPHNQRQSTSQYLELWIPRVLEGWYVNFSMTPEYGLQSQHVSFPQTSFCVGLANGWADNKKTVLIMPEDAGTAYNYLKNKGLEPRGFTFWVIDDEGETPPGQNQPLFMASGLNKFLHTRK